MMDNKTLAISTALIAIAFVAGAFLGYCLNGTPPAVAASDSGTAYPHPGDHVYTMSANGTTVELKKGTVFMIALPENGGSTGYLWDITSTQGLDVLESLLVPGSSGLIGEPGTREWVIRAGHAGQQKSIATLHRPSTDLSGNESTFVLTVNVVE